MTKSLHSCLLLHDKHFLYELGVVQSSHRPARRTNNEHWGLVCGYLPKISCAYTSMCRWESSSKSSLTLCQPTHLNVNIMNIYIFSHCYYTATLFFFREEKKYSSFLRKSKVFVDVFFSLLVFVRMLSAPAYCMTQGLYSFETALDRYSKFQRVLDEAH